jgi:hypothetical protein
LRSVDVDALSGVAGELEGFVLELEFANEGVMEAFDAGAVVARWRASLDLGERPGPSRREPSDTQAPRRARRMAVTAPPSALPFDAFITAPTRAPIALSLPPT